MRHTVGSVPYLNARPLVEAFVHDPASPIEVLFDVPSRLPAMLDDGRAQAILVSSIEALTRQDARIAAGVSISSFGEVLSVRLFSKVPFAEIRSLAMDRSSMTSNALAQIVLSERYGARPDTAHADPNLEEMLQAHDAGILIGDNGMREQRDDLHIADLGEEWTALTGLPFVWAVWLGGQELTGEFGAWLYTAMMGGQARLDKIVDREVEMGRWERELCGRYLKQVMCYDLGKDQLAGLKRFSELLVKHDLVERAQWPEVIAPEFSGILAEAH